MPEHDETVARETQARSARPRTTADGEPRVPLGGALPACLLAWAVPGLGHLFLRRSGRGALFGLMILGVFVGGLLLGGKVYRPLPGEPLTYLAALGASGVGVPFLVAHYTGLADGEIEGAFFDYGNTFTLVAGLLNLLVVLDAFDIAAGRR